MHQNRFRLGLRPRPRWGSLQCSPRPPSWIKGGLLLREGDMGKEGKGRKGRGRQGRGGEGEGGEGKGREGTPQYFIAPPSSSFLEICLAPQMQLPSSSTYIIYHLPSVLVMVQLRAKCLASSVPSSKNKRRSLKP